jgi:hypothetical protein
MIRNQNIEDFRNKKKHKNTTVKRKHNRQQQQVLSLPLTRVSTIFTIAKSTTLSLPSSTR